MVEIRSYGSTPAHSFAPRAARRSKAAFLGAVACTLAVVTLVTVNQGGPSVLFSGYRSLDPWRLSYPWDSSQSPYTYGYQPVERGYDPLSWGQYVQEQPGYSAQKCMPNPFEDLPPGYLCQSIRHGAYLLDPYGKLYNRRIQWKARKVVRDQTEEMEKTMEQSHKPKVKHTFKMPLPKGHVVTPLDWVLPHLLPNETASQEAIVAFYAAISTPNNANLSNFTDFLADDFVYQGPQATLLPACVPAIGGGKQAVGPEAWVAAFEEQLDAFGPTESSLHGNVSCSVIQTEEPLDPQLKCVAKHLCTFELKSLKNSTNGNVTLVGEIEDTFYFGKHGKIVFLRSDLEPSEFKAVGPEDEEEEDLGGGDNSTDVGNSTNTTRRR